MKRLSAAVMAVGLLAAGVASAQTSRQYGTSSSLGLSPKVCNPEENNRFSKTCKYSYNSTK